MPRQQQEEDMTIMTTSSPSSNKSSSGSSDSEKTKRNDRSNRRRSRSPKKGDNKDHHQRRREKKKENSIESQEKKKKKQKNSTRPTLSNNAVRFAKHDHIYEIPHIDDLSPEEIDQVWLSPDELKSIRRSAVTILKSMSTEDAQLRLNGLIIRSNSSRNLLKRSEQLQGNSSTSSSSSQSNKGVHDLLDDSYRGLETNTKEHMKKRSMETSIMQDTVFRLQPFKSTQEKQDVDIDQMISDLLSKYSGPSVATAIRRAKRDEKTAMKIHYDEDNDNNNNNNETPPTLSPRRSSEGINSNKTKRRVKNKLPTVPQQQDRRSSPTVVQYVRS